MFGKHSVRAVLLARPESVTRLLMAGKESYHQDLIKLARRAGIEPELLAVAGVPPRRRGRRR